MYFLGLVLEKDLLKGNIYPYYRLCKIHNKISDNFLNISLTPDKNYNKDKLMLFSSVYDKEYLINYLSYYRVFVDLKKSYKKYHPKGALFWFECSKNCVPTGLALFIKNVPDRSFASKRDTMYTYVRDELNKVEEYKMTKILSSDFNSHVYKIEEVKMQLPQYERHAEARHRKQQKKGSKKSK